MQKFIGTKLVMATPMTRAAYNEYRGWGLPENENGEDAGFLVEYIDGGPANDSRHEGYISWSPADVFNGHYQPTTNMNFSHALDILKRGGAVSRNGWNGKGMFLFLVQAPERGISLQSEVTKQFFGEDVLVPYASYVAMKTATGEVVPWLCSVTDMLAEDWQVTSIAYSGE